MKLSWLRSVFNPRSSRDPYAAPFGDLPPLPAGSLLDQDNGFARRAAPAQEGSGGDGNTSRAPSLPAIRGRERRAF